ncbi:MAG: CBS domain-containing protein [Limnochordia bacterium]|nr:CBS domain-containing protein [Limnochordia bacterium]MDD2629286.1 CBS domain-containing protein [Limnochordia bacterium]MDD4518616.1 CBS domain-containing protein [Limnochordia bacterium]
MNADVFLATFHQIERHLARIVNSKRHESFGRLVGLASSKSAVVRAYADDLREYADLRNAIVHQRTEPERVIADPLPETVEHIQKIRDALVRPLNVYPLFKIDVETLDVNDPMGKVFDFVVRKDYSKFPVYDRGSKYCGFITEKEITRWVAQAQFGSMQQLKEAPVKEVLSFIDCDNSAAFIPPDTTAYDAREIFAGRDGKTLRALLISERGLSTDPLLGIITPKSLLSVEF